jgi:hypothetical protein
MPYEIKLKAPPAGFAAERCQGPGEVTIYTGGLFTPESGRHFYNMLDGLAQAYLGPYLAKGPKLVSNVNDLLVIVRKDLNATVYVNELGYRAKIRPRRTIKKGEGVAREDIADVDDFEIIHPTAGNISIGKEEGFYLLFRAGWKQALYFDLTPLTGDPREIPWGRTLAQCWTMLTFDEIFSLTDEDFERLFDIGWFPFISIRGKPFEHLSDAITNDADSTQAVDGICGLFDEAALDEMLKRFEKYDFLKENMPFLETGINRFKAGDYLSSVHVVWPRIEGLMRRLLDPIEGRPSQRQLVETLRDHVLTNRPFSQLYMPVRFCEYLLAVYFKDFEVADAEIDVSRHSLAHGTATPEDFGKQKALIGLLTVEQIAYYTS